MVREFRILRGSLACVSLSAVVVACGGPLLDDSHTSGESLGETAPAAESASETMSWPDGARLLAEVRPGGEAIVRFYEIEEGTIVAAGRIDSGDGTLLPGTGAGEARGLADLYKALAGANADPALMVKLLASDEAARERVEAQDIVADHPHEELRETPSAAGDEPEIFTRQTACFQSEAFYMQDASVFAANFCGIDGLPNLHCLTNRTESLIDGYHRARKYRSDSFNQTLCNFARFKCTWKRGSTVNHFFTRTVGPRERFFCFGNTSNTGTDWHAEITDEGGPERPHLCLSVNRSK